MIHRMRKGILFLITLSSLIVLRGSARAQLTDETRERLSSAIETREMKDVLEIVHDYPDALTDTSYQGGTSWVDWAITVDADSIAIKLISMGADIHHRGEYGTTCAFDAIQHNSIDVLQALLDRGVCADDTCALGSLLDMALQKDNEAMVILLLERGASLVPPPGSERHLPLRAATACGTSIVRRLLAAGANPNIRDPWRNQFPLTGACALGRMEIVELLVKAGANVNADEDNGESALAGAVKSGDESIIKYLLAHGANLNPHTSIDRTPLGTAIEKGNLDLAKFLVGLGANPKYTDSSGNGLMNLTIAGKSKMVRDLIARLSE